MAFLVPVTTSFTHAFRITEMRQVGVLHFLLSDSFLYRLSSSVKINNDSAKGWRSCVKPLVRLKVFECKHRFKNGLSHCRSANTNRAAH